MPGTKAKASTQGRKIKDTIEKTSQVPSQGQRLANFIGSMQLPERMPAARTIGKPIQRLAATGCCLSQVTREPRFLRGLVDPVGHGCRMAEVLTQMRDMFEKESFMPHGNVVEQDQVLMDLPHIADMRHHRETVFTGKQAGGDELRYAGKPGAVGLHKMDGFGFDKVLEEHKIGHVLAERYSHRYDLARQLAVCLNVVRVCGFFYPVGVHGSQRCAHLPGLGERPLLVGIEHNGALGANDFAKQVGTPHIAFAILRTDLQFDGLEAGVERFLCVFADSFIFVLEPADGGVIAGIAGAKNAFTPGTCCKVIAKDGERLFAGEVIFEVVEVEQINELFRSEVEQKTPQRHLPGLCPEVETGVDDGCERQVDDALMRAKPAHSRFVGHTARHDAEVRHKLFNVEVAEMCAQILDRFAHELIAGTEG